MGWDSGNPHDNWPGPFQGHSVLYVLGWCQRCVTINNFPCLIRRGTRVQVLTKGPSCSHCMSTACLHWERTWKQGFGPQTEPREPSWALSPPCWTVMNTTCPLRTDIEKGLRRRAGDDVLITRHPDKHWITLVIPHVKLMDGFWSRL